MPIVFEEVQGVVTSEAEPEVPEGLAEAIPAPPPPPDPEWVARAMRIHNQRKARLFAD